jgi:hypothetical protein
MKKTVCLFLVVTLLLGLSFSMVSASNIHRYQGDPYRSSASYYKPNYGGGYYDYDGVYRYKTVNQAQKPIFKGSYGNYRVQGYFQGDVRPSYFFVNYPEFGFRPYFGGGNFGGYGGYYGLGGYGFGNCYFGGCGYRYPSYSYSYVF